MCRELGEIGALLRREGLYSSHLVKWRSEYANAGLAALSETRRGRKSKRQPGEIERLRRENAHPEQRLAEGAAEVESAEQMSEFIGRNALHILEETQAPSTLSYALFCTLLHFIRPPLAFLYPTREFRTMLAEGMHPLLPLDAAIRERHATALDPLSGEPWPRELLLQCPPLPPHPDEVEGTLPPPMVDLLRFTPEEVSASYAPGERVLEFARTNWNWQALEEIAAQKAN